MTETNSDGDRKRPDQRLLSPGREASAAAGEDELRVWGVYRPEPWDLVGVFASRDDAEGERARAGSDYRMEWGRARVGSPEFSPEPPAL